MKWRTIGMYKKKRKFLTAAKISILNKALYPPGGARLLYFPSSSRGAYSSKKKSEINSRRAYCSPRSFWFYASKSSSRWDIPCVVCIHAYIYTFAREYVLARAWKSSIGAGSPPGLIIPSVGRRCFFSPLSPSFARCFVEKGMSLENSRCNFVVRNLERNGIIAGDYLKKPFETRALRMRVENYRTYTSTSN